MKIKCTSRPDCPCDFWVRVRREMDAGTDAKSQRDKLANGQRRREV